MEKKEERLPIKEAAACPTCSREFLRESGSGYTQCSGCLRDGVMLLRE